MKSYVFRSRCRGKLRLATVAVGLVAALMLAAASVPGIAAADQTSPSFQILSPANGSTVSDPVKLSIAVHGAKIGLPSSGDDHLHISIDGGEPIAMYRLRDVDLNLPAGPHTIAVELAWPTHMPIGPWQKTTFTVH